MFLYLQYFLGIVLKNKGFLMSRWDVCLNNLRSMLSEQEHTTWIQPLIVDDQGKLFTIYAPNRFFLDWIKSRFAKKIIDCIESNSDSEVMVEFSIKKSPQRTGYISPIQNNEILKTKKSIKPTAGPQLEMFNELKRNQKNELNLNEIKYSELGQPEETNEHYLKSGTTNELFGFDEALALPIERQETKFGLRLKGEFSFESFVEGASNEIAKAAAMQVSVSPGAAYNPLFLYGSSGLGKTHLMHAIGNEVMKFQPDAKILYVTSEQYVKDMVDALRVGAMEHFQNYYRSVDVLLVDDIQFIANKGQTQVEFFHTFNALLDQGKQIVLSCDRYPKEIEGLEDRLKSRFGHGLTVTIEVPELETRVAILLHKSHVFGVEISQDVAFFIAKYVRSNVRELEGALRRVMTSAKIQRKEITTQFVSEVLKDIISIQEKLVKVDNIQKTVADYYRIKVSDLTSKQKSRDIARPRQMAMALAKELTHHSLPEIGQFFGGRDHSTVIHAVKTIDKLKKTNFSIKDDYQNLSRKISQ
jgi:chromosomal replication initiator protein